MIYKPTKDKLIKRVPVGSLMLHLLAQREIVQGLVDHIKTNFNPDAVGVLHVVVRRVKGVDVYQIVDGQHRWRAMMDLKMESALIEVEIHLGAVTDQQACELFLLLNYKRGIRPWDTFDKSVKAEFPFAVAIMASLNRCKLKVGRTGGDATVCAVGALTALYHWDCGEILNKVLTIVTLSWGMSQAGLEGRLLLGIGAFLRHYGPLVEIKALIPLLREFDGGPGEVLAKGKGIKSTIGVSMIVGVAMQVAKIYNTHRRSNKLLPMAAML